MSTEQGALVGESRPGLLLQPAGAAVFFTEAQTQRAPVVQSTETWSQGLGSNPALSLSFLSVKWDGNSSNVRRLM